MIAKRNKTTKYKKPAPVHFVQPIDMSKSKEDIFGTYLDTLHMWKQISGMEFPDFIFDRTKLFDVLLKNKCKSIVITNNDIGEEHNENRTFKMLFYTENHHLCFTASPSPDTYVLTWTASKLLDLKNKITMLESVLGDGHKFKFSEKDFIQNNIDMILIRAEYKKTLADKENPFKKDFVVVVYGKKQFATVYLPNGEKLLRG